MASNLDQEDYGAHSSIAKLARAIRNKEVSPVEIVNQLLDGIGKVNGELNAYITVLGETALQTAKRAEKDAVEGNIRGPLHGVPLAIKDIIYTADVRTTMGSAFFADHVPHYNSAVVERLEDAGAVIMGKLNTHEFAYGPTGDRSYSGPARNPYDTARITGGSSGGAGAAVAAGLCYGAVGTDTGGSVRIPAALCGVVGMKPTYGRVSLYGVFPLAWSLDHAGPLTRTVEDNALLLNALAGHDHRDPCSVVRDSEDFTRDLVKSIRGSTIGIPSSFYFDSLSEEVKAVVEQAIETFRRLGAEVRTLEMTGLEQYLHAQRLMLASEAYAVHQERFEQEPKKFEEDVRERLAAGADAKAYEYARARRLQVMAGEEFNRALEKVEVLLTPTVPITAPPIWQREIDVCGSRELVRSAVTRYTGLTNFTGHPSLSVPCSSAPDLPIGLQLIGGRFDEATVYRFGRAFELEAGLTEVSPTGCGEEAKKGTSTRTTHREPRS